MYKNIGHLPRIYFLLDLNETKWLIEVLLQQQNV